MLLERLLHREHHRNRSARTRPSLQIDLCVQPLGNRQGQNSAHAMNLERHGHVRVAMPNHGALVSEWYSLIDPDDFFDPVNISIDGITEGGVRDAPTFCDASSDIERFLRGQVVVTHTHFDGVAIHQAAG